MAIQAIAENMDKAVKDDRTEATVNRKLWNEVFENDIILTLPQAESLLSESSRLTSRIHDSHLLKFQITQDPKDKLIQTQETSGQTSPFPMNSTEEKRLGVNSSEVQSDTLSRMFALDSRRMAETEMDWDTTEEMDAGQTLEELVVNSWYRLDTDVIV